MGDIIKLHNETVNVWSHSSAAVLLWWSSIVSWGPFTLSSIYHLFCTHSENILIWTLTLDHLSVVIIIWGAITRVL